MRGTGFGTSKMKFYSDAKSRPLPTGIRLKRHRRAEVTDRANVMVKPNVIKL
jgi:hypothetical protein